MIRGGIALLGLFALSAFSFSMGPLHWPSVLYGIVTTIFVLRIGDGVRAAWRERQPR